MTRTLIRSLFLLSALCGVLCALTVFSSDLELSIWLSTRLGVAHALAFPRISGAGVLILALVLCLVTALYARRGYRRVFAGAVVLSLIWGAPAGLLLVSPYTLMQKREMIAVGCAENREYRVTTWNAQGHVGTDAWEQLLTEDPDMLVLPESDPAEVARLSGVDHYQLFASAPNPENPRIAPVTLLVHERLGTYRQRASHNLSFGGITVEPVSGQTPTLTGVHLAPPLPELMERWRADLAQVRTIMRESGGDIIAGDFNATLHHGGLAQPGLLDAAAEAGISEGTWPAGVNTALSSPIDHILLSGGGANGVLSASVFDPGGSDHLAVTAELNLCG